MSTNSDIGVSILNSMGANHFDVSKMAKTLAEAGVAAQRANLDSNETKFSNTLTGFSTLKAAFQGFTSQISKLLDISNFQQKSVTSSNPSIVDATVNGTTNNGLYQVEVQSMASAHTLATQSQYASTNTAIGQGTLTFNVGGTVSNITIDATNNTLAGIQDAVNKANIGVNATVVNVGTGYKLMFSSAQTGASNQIDISVTGDTDGNNTDAAGLSQLVTANMTETVAAKDATVVVNGLTINNASNNIDGVIPGVTLNLKSASVGVTNTLQISNDTSGLETAVSDFVDLYNSLDSIMGTLGSYDKPKNTDPNSTDQTGYLKGDATLRTVKSEIKQAMIESIPGLSGAVQSLADIGVTSNLDGTLSLDKSKLSSALAADPTAVGKLFAASATASDTLVTYKGSTSDTIEGTYNLNVNTAASQASITGAGMGGGNVTIDATNNTLQVSVDGATSATLTLNAGTYAPADLAKEIARVINNDQAISSGGSKVSVQYDSTAQAFSINSEKYGSASSVGLLSGNFLTSGVSGLGVTAATSGTDVQGYLEQGGTLYTFTGTGQDVTINSFLPGAPKGLSFTVGGVQTGARGTIDFNRGYADKLNQLFDQIVNPDTGIVGTRMSNIQSRLDEISTQKTKVDDRYNRLEQKYLMQFGALQSLLSKMDNTKQSLAASLGMNTNSGN